MKQIMYNNETINVLEATGYNDGYYWDMNAEIEFRGETYSLYDAGSGSGYVPICSAIKKGALERLYGEEQYDIDEDEWDYFERSIVRLLNKFIESEAKTSWESMEDDDWWNMKVLVDGVEIETEDEDEES